MLYKGLALYLSCVFAFRNKFQKKKTYPIGQRAEMALQRKGRNK